jgi:hypothetical protein
LAAIEKITATLGSIHRCGL